MEQINLDGYDIIGKDKLVYEFSMQEKDGNSDLYSNLLKIYHINLKHLEKTMKKDYNNLEKYSLFERIGMIFMTKNKEDLKNVVRNDKYLSKIMKAIEEINQDNSLIEQYSKHDLEVMAEVQEKLQEVEEKLQEAKEKEQEAKEKEQEAKERVQEGIEKGIEQGEKNKQIEIAKNMLNLNIEISLIEKATGLSEKEIKMIKKQ